MAKTFVWDRFDVDHTGYEIDTADGRCVLAQDAIDREAVLQAEIRTLELRLKEAKQPPKCEHVMTRYVRDCSMCEDCGAILTDGTWGAQSGKWFKSYTEALQEHNR